MVDLEGKGFTVAFPRFLALFVPCSLSSLLSFSAFIGGEGPRSFLSGILLQSLLMMQEIQERLVVELPQHGRRSTAYNNIKIRLQTG